jgi:hypothetical protein
VHRNFMRRLVLHEPEISTGLEMQNDRHAPAPMISSPINLSRQLLPPADKIQQKQKDLTHRRRLDGSAESGEVRPADPAYNIAAYVPVAQCTAPSTTSLFSSPALSRRPLVGANAGMVAAASSGAAAGYALAATAMALSGTLVLLSICRAKPSPGCPAEAPPRLRPCLSSSSGKCSATLL